MRLRLIRLVLRILGMLPLRVNHALGATIGLLAWKLPTPARRITLINLALCYPDRDPRFYNRLARLSLIETGKSFTELGYLWFKSRKTLENLLRNVYGREHLKAAKASGQGLLLISPHLGAWELCMLPLAKENSSIVMYRPPRQSLVEPVIIEARSRYGVELAKLTQTGIKTVLRGLKEGRTVGILPDQEPDIENGVFAPFFGVPANTMTLLPRLANRSNAGMVFIFCERLPRGRGYNLHYLPADTAIGSSDTLTATTSLNQCLQNCISLIPEQYNWSYKRFRNCEDGTRRRYSEHELPY